MISLCNVVRDASSTKDLYLPARQVQREQAFKPVGHDGGTPGDSREIVVSATSTASKGSEEVAMFDAHGTHITTGKWQGPARYALQQVI